MFSLALFLAGCSSWTSLLRGAAEDGPPVEARCAQPMDFSCWERVPEGDVWMGAQASDPAAPGYDPQAAPNEAPYRKAHVPAFWMYRTEIAAYVFKQCVNRGVCKESDVSLEGGYSTYLETADHAALNTPINSITWGGAQRLCSYLGGRLPTEAEWERAARGDDGRIFPWGNDPGCGVRVPENGPSDQLRDRTEMLRSECSKAGLQRVEIDVGIGPFGVMGQAGNVWEWVEDPYGAERVQKGGGWTSDDPWDVRAATRGHMEENARSNDVGVRCVWGASKK